MCHWTGYGFYPLCPIKTGYTISCENVCRYNYKQGIASMIWGGAGNPGT